MGLGRHSVLSFLILYGIVFLGVSPLYSQQKNLPELRNNLLLLHIGHLNTDGIPDTLMGFVNERHQVLPRLILWGAEEQGHQPSAPATTTPEQRATIIHYPVGQCYGSVSIEQYNSNDSLDDILLYLWGREIKGKDTIPYRMSLVIFGQPGLDSIPFIDVGTIALVQERPFRAMQLRPNMELAEPAIREVSGAVSYILPRIILPVIADTTKQPLEEHITDVQGTKVMVYPNPAVVEAYVKAIGVMPQNYSLDLFDAQGRLIFSQSVRADAEGSFLQSLPMATVASGYYLLRLVSPKGMVGAYPILVIH